MTDILTPEQRWAAFLQAWADQLGVGARATLAQIAALPGAAEWLTSGDARELGAALRRNAATDPRLRVRRVRKGRMARTPVRATHPWRYKPALWVLERVDETSGH